MTIRIFSVVVVINPARSSLVVVVELPRPPWLRECTATRYDYSPGFLSASHIFSLFQHGWVPDGSWMSVSRPTTSTRPKTAFQAINSRFEKVLSELRGVHLRTMKPASLPPITSVATRQRDHNRDHCRDQNILLRDMNSKGRGESHILGAFNNKAEDLPHII